ncbi:MAG: hypothetical protein ACJ75J_01330 [Cytophagaceae bacterium]
MKIIEDETGKFYLEDGIAHCIFPKDIVVDLETMKKGVQNRIAISEGVSRPVLIDATGVKYYTWESKEYGHTSPEAELLILSCAIIIDSVPLRISVNWALTFFPPAFPVKLFSDKDKAIAWLKKKSALN